MRKTIVLLVAALLVVTTLAGCGDGIAPKESTAPSEAVSEAPETDNASPEEFGGDTSKAPSDDTAAAGNAEKIGVIFYSKDDSLGAAVYSTINYAAEVLGVEIMWKLGDLEPTAQITAAENMISAGVQGIMCIPLSEVVTQKVSKLCEDNDVKFAICFRTINDESIKAAVDANPNFVGSCSEDEVAAGEQLIKLMVDDGRTNLGLGYIYPGNALELRNDGFRNGMEQYGATQLAEYTISQDGNTNTHISSIQNFLNSYPDMNGIVLASASVGAGEAIVNTLAEIVTDGKVKLGTFDVFEGMDMAFENGTLAVAVGGMSPDALMTFMMLYNAVDGTPLSDKCEYITQNYIFVTSSEECAAYQKYIDNPEYMIYDAEDIKAMSKRLNPDFSLDGLKQIMADYTIQNVIAAAEGSS